MLLALGSQGPAIALVMGVFILLANGPLQQLIQPIAFGAALGIHPLAVLIVTIAGGCLFGGIGLILAAPLTAAAAHVSTDLALARARRRDDDGTVAPAAEPFVAAVAGAARRRGTAGARAGRLDGSARRNVRICVWVAQEAAPRQLPASAVAWSSAACVPPLENAVFTASSTPRRHAVASCASALNPCTLALVRSSALDASAFALRAASASAAAFSRSFWMPARFSFVAPSAAVSSSIACCVAASGVAAGGGVAVAVAVRRGRGLLRLRRLARRGGRRRRLELLLAVVGVGLRAQRPDAEADHGEHEHAAERDQPLGPAVLRLRVAVARGDRRCGRRPPALPRHSRARSRLAGRGPSGIVVVARGHGSPPGLGRCVL